MKLETKITLNSPIVEIANKDSTTREITMLVHKLDLVNGNGLDFKEEYTSQYMSTLINKPVVASYYPIKDDLGDHEPVFDENGKIIELRTIAIGTIKDVWIADHAINSSETVRALFAKAVVWSYKYPQIMQCIERLFNSQNSTSSVEIEIYQYGENPTQQYRYATNYSYLGNCLLGSTVTPADSDAGVINVFQREVAMAVEQDLKLNNIKEGGTEVDKVIFNKGFDTKFHGDIQINELSYQDIRDQIYNIINPTNPQTEEREYHYWIRDLYQTYVILEDWNNSSIMFKCGYTVTSNIVALEARENWIQVELTYQPIGTNINQLLSDKEKEVTELSNKLKEEVKLTEQEIQDLQTKVETLTSEISSLKETIVAQEEAKKTLESEKVELASKVEELTPFKEQVELAEKQAKQTELSEKYTKLLSAEAQATDEFKAAITELNQTALNEMVVTEAIAKAKTPEVASKKEEEAVIVVAAKTEDLLPTDKKDRWYSAKSE